MRAVAQDPVVIKFGAYIEDAGDEYGFKRLYRELTITDAGRWRYEAPLSFLDHFIRKLCQANNIPPPRLEPFKSPERRALGDADAGASESLYFSFSDTVDFAGGYEGYLRLETNLARLMMESDSVKAAAAAAPMMVIDAAREAEVRARTGVMDPGVEVRAKNKRFYWVHPTFVKSILSAMAQDNKIYYHALQRHEAALSDMYRMYFDRGGSVQEGLRRVMQNYADYGNCVKRLFAKTLREAVGARETRHFTGRIDDLMGTIQGCFNPRGGRGVSAAINAVYKELGNVIEIIYQNAEDKIIELGMTRQERRAGIKSLSAERRAAILVKQRTAINRGNTAAIASAIEVAPERVLVIFNEIVGRLSGVAVVPDYHAIVTLDEKYHSSRYLRHLVYVLLELVKFRDERLAQAPGAVAVPPPGMGAARAAGPTTVGGLYGSPRGAPAGGAGGGWGGGSSAAGYSGGGGGRGGSGWDDPAPAYGARGAPAGGAGGYGWDLRPVRGARVPAASGGGSRLSLPGGILVGSDDCPIALGGAGGAAAAPDYEWGRDNPFGTSGSGLGGIPGASVGSGRGGVASGRPFGILPPPSTRRSLTGAALGARASVPAATSGATAAPPPAAAAPAPSAPPSSLPVPSGGVR